MIYLYFNTRALRGGGAIRRGILPLYSTSKLRHGLEAILRKRCFKCVTITYS
jgi:hypothetical protein